MKVPDAPNLPGIAPRTAFLANLAEVGRLIGAFDWGHVSVGSIAAWRGYRRTTFSTILRSWVPMVTLWDADGVMIYDKGYSAFADPRLIGSPVREGWPGVADFKDKVMKTLLLRGGTPFYREQEITLFRPALAEPDWLDLDNSPMPDEQNCPASVQKATT
jgi:hypothetical protein